MTKKLLRQIFPGFIVCLALLISATSFAQAPEFMIGSKDNVSATSVVVPVTAKNFNQILGWQGSINWDNSKLNYVSVSSPVTQLTGMQFNPSISSSTGRLSFLWVDNNLQPKTIADSIVLFSITFNVVSGAAGISEVSFANSPTQLLVSDAAGNSIEKVNYINGSIAFPGVALAPEFSIGSALNVTLNTVSIPVTAKNFIQLMAFQGSVNWDNTKLNYSGITSTNNQLSGIQFEDTVLSNNGHLAFLWADENVQAQTISDNSVLFNIIFNVVAGAKGSTDISFTNAPTQLLVSNAQGGTINDVVYNKGVVAFPGALLPPQFSIGSAYNIFSDSVVIPVTVKNFTDLLAWQGSINWDNNKLSFIRISNQNEKLSGILFNPMVDSTNSGKISFVWADKNSTPQTMADTAVLFSIVFDVNSSSGFAEINFGDMPTPLFVSDKNSVAAGGVVHKSGTITFTSLLCPNGNTTITSDVRGAAYQWQVNTGNGTFVNISDNSQYSGTGTMTLQLESIPSSWSGYQFRCIVNGFSSDVFTLRFRDFWYGTSGTAWENLSNWSCIQKLPDSNTEVFIPQGNVILKSNVEVKSLTLGEGANLIVQPGYHIIIKGN